MKPIALAVLFLCACGVPLADPLESRQDAVTSSCGSASDDGCLGKTAGASCDGSGTCYADAELPGACNCVMPSPPPPSSTKCRCSDGTAFGQHCVSNPALTCSGTYNGWYLSCACQ